MFPRRLVHFGVVDYNICISSTITVTLFSPVHFRDGRGWDRMVLGFTTTHAISAYHHRCCELESRSGRDVQHYVIKIVWRKTSRWFCPGPPVSSTNKTYRHDITEILLKVALNTIKQTNKQTSMQCLLEDWLILVWWTMYLLSDSAIMFRHFGLLAVTDFWIISLLILWPWTFLINM